MKKSSSTVVSFVFFFSILVGTAYGVGIGSQIIVSVIPGAPSSLSATANSPTQISLSWTDNASNELGFAIERRTTLTSFLEIATTSANIGVYTDNAVSPATDYFYRVRAFNADGYSGYSNEATTTTPGVGGGGSVGIGGGGGGGVSSFPTEVVFRGLAYKSALVTLLRDGQIIATSTSGADGRFELKVSNANPGSYVFGIWSEDEAKNRSITQTFNITLSAGATTLVSSVFIPPFLTADKKEVRKGDALEIEGVVAPQSSITMLYAGGLSLVTRATATSEGIWRSIQSTTNLPKGDYTLRAEAMRDGERSTFSNILSFKVGDKNVPAPRLAKCGWKADVNKDCRVNLVDFSILAFWFRRPLEEIEREIYDLNADGQVNLVDFSILAYYWTG